MTQHYLDYDDRREASKLKRASNRESSARRLREQEIPFTEHNAGAHLVVTPWPGIVFDFWPGTGKFTRRGSGKYGRGVGPLIHEILNIGTKESAALDADADREMIGDDADFGLGPIGFK